MTTHDIGVASGIIDRKLDIFDTDFAPQIDKVKAVDGARLRLVMKKIRIP